MASGQDSGDAGILMMVTMSVAEAVDVAVVVAEQLLLDLHKKELMTPP